MTLTEETVTAETLWTDILKIRKEAPLVHNITNYVVMNTTANALLALGASPVMAHAINEAEEMAGIARALVLNIGTLSDAWIEAMLIAGKAAKKKGIPVILDPVGSGATRYRTTTALRILNETAPSIVRGNASEIASLAGDISSTKGVDSTRSSESTVDLAIALSKKYNCAVSLSGATDMIADGDSLVRIHNGHPMMTRVTGLGCTASAITGAFAAVNPSRQLAAAHAMALLGIAGEMAAERTKAPGSLQTALIDMLYLINEKDIRKRLRAD
jgi:hydroxyethylthiazole kinase